MEPILHLIIPILFLISFFPKIEKKLIFGLAIFTILPDFDIIIPSMHRFLFHNIFFVLITALIMFFVFGRLYASISLFFLSSHLIMDFTYNGLGLFYPFYKRLIALDVGIIKNLSTNSFDFIFGLKTNSLGKIIETTQHHYLTTEGFLILILAVILLIIKYYSPSNSTKV